MRTVWVAVGVLGMVLVATAANADTVYLKTGESVWGSDVYEEGDTVVIVRPGGELRFPRGEVSRIERLRTTLPPFYTPPGLPPAPETERGGAPAAPGTPGAPGSAGSPAPPAAGGAPSVPSTPPAVPSPEAGPTQLPPPPPPPMPGTQPPR
ncbi:MAG TPA: hypothetical protein VLT62_17345 [Candidatus Methylomirabilis sp.]|nr:hypothetical protein [Candidatus Methylomirabilis sp.]